MSLPLSSILFPKEPNCMSFEVILTEPVPIVKLPLTTASPPKSDTVRVAPPLPPSVPDTKKLTSAPGSDAGNNASGRLAMITVPETAISEFDCVLPEICPTKAIVFNLQKNIFYQ